MRLSVVRALMWSSVAVLATSASPAQALTNATEQLFRCHIRVRAPYLCDYTGGCDRDQKLGRERLDASYRCMREFLRCDLLERLGLPGLDRCMTRAGRRCTHAQWRQDTWIAVMAQNQRDAILSECGEQNLQDDEFLGVPLGLGYGQDAAICGQMFGMSFADPADYIECGDRYVTRLHAQLLSLLAPRSQQLIEDNGWCSLFPEEGVTPIICNTALVPSPPSPPQLVPEAKVRELRHCQQRLATTIPRDALEAHLNLLENCAEEYLNCNLKEARGEFVAGVYENCISQAHATCTRFEEARDRRLPAAIRKLNSACAKPTFEDLRDVLGFVDVASSCGANSVDDLMTCIVDRVPCLAWDIVRYTEPRILMDVPSEFLTYYDSCGE
jgi:hypothetical protein